MKSLYYQTIPPRHRSKCRRRRRWRNQRQMRACLLLSRPPSSCASCLWSQLRRYEIISRPNTKEMKWSQGCKPWNWYLTLSCRRWRILNPSKSILTCCLTLQVESDYLAHPFQNQGLLEKNPSNDTSKIWGNNYILRKHQGYVKNLSSRVVECSTSTEAKKSHEVGRWYWGCLTCKTSWS